MRVLCSKCVAFGVFRKSRVHGLQSVSCGRWTKNVEETALQVLGKLTLLTAGAT